MLYLHENYLHILSTIQEGFYSNPETTPTVTAPGVLLVISSLGITIFYALGPGMEVTLSDVRTLIIT
jgi:hypothetical protein